MFFPFEHLLFWANNLLDTRNSHGIRVHHCENILWNMKKHGCESCYQLFFWEVYLEGEKRHKLKGRSGVTFGKRSTTTTGPTTGSGSVAEKAGGRH